MIKLGCLFLFLVLQYFCRAKVVLLSHTFELVVSSVSQVASYPICHVYFSWDVTLHYIDANGYVQLLS